MDTGDRAVVHRFFDFFLGRPEGIVDHRLVLMVPPFAFGFLHAEYFRADLGTGFAADAGILIDNGDAGHVEFLSTMETGAINVKYTAFFTIMAF
jgi:hypothetical protein